MPRFELAGTIITAQCMSLLCAARYVEHHYMHQLRRCSSTVVGQGAHCTMDVCRRSRRAVSAAAQREVSCRIDPTIHVSMVMAARRVFSVTS